MANQQLDRNRPLWQIRVVAGLRSGEHFAVISYNGSICWGITGDPNVVADLPVFMKFLAKAIGKVGVAAHCGGVPKVS